MPSMSASFSFPIPIVHSLVMALCVLAGCSAIPATDSPDIVVRKMFQANADRDLKTIESLVSKDADMVGYTIGGRKYVGWNDLVRDMRMEFESVNRLEIPVRELRIWEHGDVAWYTVDLDYIRYEGTGLEQRKTILPLRESGVLERREGRWLLVQWHESLERAPEIQSVDARDHQSLDDHSAWKVPIDLSGEWEIQETDKTYRLVLDQSGSGSYTWQNGMFTTTRLTEGRWEGLWLQPGNDREGGFEVHLTDDRMAAHGRWWYTRVGKQSNIPPRQWGGEYRFKRMPSRLDNHSIP